MKEKMDEEKKNLFVCFWLESEVEVDVLDRRSYRATITATEAGGKAGRPPRQLPPTAPVTEAGRKEGTACAAARRDWRDVEPTTDRLALDSVQGRCFPNSLQSHVIWIPIIELHLLSSLLSIF